MEDKKIITQSGKQEKRNWSPSNPWEKPKMPAVQTPPQQEKPTEFQLHAPHAQTVSVAGTFNRWNTGAFSLKKDFQGAWKGQIRLKPGQYQYRFFVDGKWSDDPKAKQTIQNEFGGKNAILEVR